MDYRLAGVDPPFRRHLEQPVARLRLGYCYPAALTREGPDDESCCFALSGELHRLVPEFQPDEIRLGVRNVPALLQECRTNAVALGHLLGVAPTPWEWDRFESAHTSIAALRTKKVAHAVAFGMTAFGDTRHLPPDQTTR